MHPVSCTYTHHAVKDMLNHRMVTPKTAGRGGGEVNLRRFGQREDQILVFGDF